MSQANESSDRYALRLWHNRSLDRQLKAFERRLTRLEETQFKLIVG